MTHGSMKHSGQRVGDSIAGHVAGAGSLTDRTGWSAWQRDAELADGATSGTITTESLADDDGPGQSRLY